MEARNPTSPANVTTVSEIQKSIECHFQFLLKHYAYLCKLEKFIVNGAEAGILAEDVQAYFKDVLGDLCPGQSVQSRHVIMVIKAMVKVNMDDLSRLLQCAKQDHEDRALCLLNLELRLLTIAKKPVRDLERMMNWSENGKTIAGIQEFYFYEWLKEQIKPTLPGCYAELEKVILIELAPGGEDSTIAINWMPLFQKYMGIIDKQRAQQAYLKAHQLTLLTFKLKKYMLDVNQRTAFLHACAKLREQIVSNIQRNRAHQVSDLKRSMHETVNYFFDHITPSLPSWVKVNEQVDAMNRYIKLAECYRDQVVIEFARDLAVLQRQYDVVHGHYATLETKVFQNDYRPDDIKRVLEKVIFTVRMLQGLLKPDLPFTIETEDDLNKLIEQFQLNYSIIFNTLEHAMNLVDAAKERMIPGQTFTPAQPESEKSLFMKEQAETLRRYKEEVEEKRRLKALAKLSVSDPVNPAAAQASERIVMANETLHARLQALSDKKLTLLKHILTGKRGIKYHKVVNLLKRLGGKIVEIGSSHKRIKLDQFYVEVMSSAASPAHLTPGVATGGLFHQHGKAHHTGDLVRFNLELVSDVLVKAGITLARVESLENSRTLRPPLTRPVN